MVELVWVAYWFIAIKHRKEAALVLIDGRILEEVLDGVVEEGLLDLLHHKVTVSVIKWQANLCGRKKPTSIIDQSKCLNAKGYIHPFIVLIFSPSYCQKDQCKGDG